MSSHTVTLNFDGGYVTQTLTCNAPPHSQCHAVFTCDCEEYPDYRIVDDHPQHVVEHDCGEEIHTGRFSPSHCHVRDWHDALQEEILHGAITFPVHVRDEPDHFVLDVVDRKRVPA